MLQFKIVRYTLSRIEEKNIEDPDRGDFFCEGSYFFGSSKENDIYDSDQSVKLNIKHSEADLKEKILKVLRISEDSLLSYEIKTVLDARRKPELFYVCRGRKGEECIIRQERVRNQNVQFRTSPVLPDSGGWN